MFGPGNYSAAVAQVPLAHYYPKSFGEDVFRHVFWPLHVDFVPGPPKDSEALLTNALQHVALRGKVPALAIKVERVNRTP